MKPADFGPNKAGRLVSVSGIRGATHAFVPDPLPPDWEWPEHLWPLLVDARASLASLNGVGKHLPNPELLLRPLQQREAQKSSSLEGTYTDPEQQILFQLDPQYPESEEDPVNALREVFNYRRALRIHTEESDIPLSLRLIRRLHEVLLDGVRGADHQPGEFRRVQNQIGWPPRFVPPPVNELMPSLDAFERYIHQDHQFDPLVEAFMLHYQFESIHPFRDGNGRVGRLLLAIMIADWCDLSDQWLYMSAFFDEHKDEYIDRLYHISTDGAWDDWVEFCLEGVVVQAEDTEKRCERLLNLNREFHARVDRIGGSHRLGAIVDSLFDSPVVRVVNLRDRFEVSYNTGKADAEKLVEAGILRELEDAPIRTFAAPEIFTITFAD